MTCSECDRLLELFQRATIDLIFQVRAKQSAEDSNEPESLERTRKRQEELRMALQKAADELNQHRRLHSGEESGDAES
jgi:hypothetical protein